MTAAVDQMEFALDNSVTLLSVGGPRTPPFVNPIAKVPAQSMADRSGDEHRRSAGFRPGGLRVLHLADEIEA